MYKYFVIIVSMLTGCSFSSFSTVKDVTVNPLVARTNSNAKATHFVNGLWYQADSKTFISTDMYSESGIFTHQKPSNAVIVDLDGAYVIPPFGEAHNHSVDGSWTLKPAIEYLNQGVFYYKNPNNVASVAQTGQSIWSRPETLDVIFANGGVSVTGGHPDILYRNLVKNYGMRIDKIEGAVFFAAPDIQALEMQWPKILEQKPDFIKLYLLNYNTEDSDGLSESVFRKAVKLAESAGLRTTVHLESMGDLLLAVDAGADEAAHLVSRKVSTAFNEDSLITEEFAKQMAQLNFVTVTTTKITELQYANKPEILARIQAVQKANLRTLYSAGAPIVIGTDSFSHTAIAEIETLRKLSVFSDLELLELWMNTPVLSIYPNRRIGKLEETYETSFLGLSCNPVENFECIKKLKVKVKQGQILE